MKEGRKANVPEDILKNACAVADRVAKNCPGALPVLSLGHFAHLTGVPYRYLRELVSRTRSDDYRIFKMQKNVPAGGGPKGKKPYRIICVPQPPLMTAQRWISQNILSKAETHSASYAYAPGSNYVDAARLHCECRWLIKLDVSRFFESITEIQAYNAILSLGYSRLVSFELARICTRAKRSLTSAKRWNSRFWRYESITEYHHEQLGYLPQGAPTSPMLSNLAMRELDQQLSDYCFANKLVYSRYADDIAISTSDVSFSRDRAAKVVSKVYELMAAHGLSPNITKTRVRTPGSRKVVLGLLVDGELPRLTRSFRDKLRQHLYYCLHPKVGPVAHAQKRSFDSVVGLKHHLDGLIVFANHVQPSFGAQCRSDFNAIDWPI